jgi:Domain of unknown function (DUF4280)
MGADSVVHGAMLQCAMGTSPGSLSLIPNQVTFENQTPATMMDYKPMVNIPTFGMCQSPANPMVAAATAAAMGVLTPQPCIPNTVAPWVPPTIPPVLMGNLPLIDKNAMCMCLWAGVITIKNPGTTKTKVP